MARPPLQPAERVAEDAERARLGTAVEHAAEGIETEAELATLKRLGIQFGQGYLLGRPQDSRKTRNWAPMVRLRAS